MSCTEWSAGCPRGAQQLTKNTCKHSYFVSPFTALIGPQNEEGCVRKV